MPRFTVDPLGIAKKNVGSAKITTIFKIESVKILVREGWNSFLCYQYR